MDSGKLSRHRPRTEHHSRKQSSAPRSQREAGGQTESGPDPGGRGPDSNGVTERSGGRDGGRDGGGKAAAEGGDGEDFSKGNLSTLVNSKGNLHAPLVLQDGPAPSLLLLTCKPSTSKLRLTACQVQGQPARPRRSPGGTRPQSSPADLHN